MREIMYRGIPKEKFDGYAFSKIWSDNCDGSFVYGSLLISKGKYYICASSIFKINCCINNAMMSVIEVIPESVGQYTGLTDKNGKKIFEGDVFKFPDEIFESYDTSCGTEYNSWEVENYGVVGFCEDFGRFEFVDYKFNENAVEADLRENHAIEFYDFVRELEIIGNIHDNPELLKEGGQV